MKLRPIYGQPENTQKLLDTSDTLGQDMYYTTTPSLYLYVYPFFNITCLGILPLPIEQLEAPEKGKPL